MGPPHSGESHWRVLRRLARQARRDGYASGPVDDAILYVVTYRRGGLEGIDPKEIVKDMPKDLIASGILWADPAMRERNRLAVFSIPEQPGTGAQLYLPYFLYPLPRWVVLEMLRGRLAVIAMLNVGRLAAAVEAKGLEVELPTTDRQWREGPLMAFTTATLADGTRYRVGVGGLHRHLVEMLMEAKPLDYFATVALAMSRATRDRLPAILEKQTKEVPKAG